MSNVSFDSPFYPYEKVYPGFNTLRGSEDIPYKLLMYLLDLPDKNGYTPVDDNARPRVRLAKYLWYDDENPLSKPLPTAKEKLSLVYNGQNAMLATDEDKKNHPKGYRIIPQGYIQPSEIYAGVVLKCFMGRAIARTDMRTAIGIRFEIAVDDSLENVMRTGVYSRLYAIYQCLIESLHGINISGVGSIAYSKEVHGDCGMTVSHDDGNHVFADVFMAVEWQEESPFAETVRVF